MKKNKKRKKQHIGCSSNPEEAEDLGIPEKYAHIKATALLITHTRERHADAIVRI